jgi:hypothetical protein
VERQYKYYRKKRNSFNFTFSIILLGMTIITTMNLVKGMEKKDGEGGMVLGDISLNFVSTFY